MSRQGLYWEVNLRDIRFLLKTHYSNSRALVIGINRYQNASPLSYAVNDAAEVRETLQGAAGFPAEHITYLADADASKTNVLKAFHRYTKDDIGLDERIFIFFAGHGHTRTGTHGKIVISSHTMLIWRISPPSSDGTS